MAALLGTIQNLTGSLKLKAESILDSVFPPEKRAELMTKLQSFAINNPKLSAFLLANIALTGFPLFMFFVFSLTVFVFSLVAALLVGLLVALLFTAFMVGVALLVVLPTVFITTMAASFIFLWGLGGYYLLKWFNEGESPAAQGTAIGDKLNSLTGGRLDFLLEGARKNEDAKQEDAKLEQVHGGAGNEKKKANGMPPKLNASAGAEHAQNAVKGTQGATDKVTKTANVDGVSKKATNATGTVTNTAGSAKGLVGGATGLA